MLNVLYNTYIWYKDQLCAFLKMGFIKDWEHLKEIIKKLD